MSYHHKNQVTFVNIIIVILSFALIYIAHSIIQYAPTKSVGEAVESAKVLKIMDIQKEELMEGITSTTILFTARMTSGDSKYQTINAMQTIDDMFFVTQQKIEPGDRIVVSYTASMDDSNENAVWFYVGPNRTPGLMLLAAVFLILILLIGKNKGLVTIFSLLVTISAIFAVYIPAILSGKNIYWMSIFITLFIILSSLTILNGLNKKTLCAVIGNIGGVLAAGILAAFVNGMLNITGMLDQEYMFLTTLDSNVPIDLRAVVWAGALIGSLGAIMDVAMSIASAMQELAVEMKDRTFTRMVQSGMNIGRDAIGTMTNTLILAYVGSSFAMILLFSAYGTNMRALLNYEMIVVEIIQAIAGSIGILLAVPITVVFAAWIFNKEDSINLPETDSDTELI